MLKRGVLPIGMLMVLSTTVRAQDRGFVMGQGGLTFAETTSGLFGAEVGVNVTPSILVIGTYEYMSDVLTGSLAETLRLLSNTTNVQITGELPASYFAGGIRLQFSQGTNVLPYIQFEAGAGKTSPDLTFVADGEDITDEVAVELDTTSAAFALCAGVRIDIGDRVTSGVAFKWLNISTEETIKINRLHFGLGFRF